MGHFCLGESYEFCKQPSCESFDLLSECQGLALKLWANPECKAMFPRGLTSMYQTAEGQGLSWELKVAAQERQKLFLQEIERNFIAPFPPAGGGRHTGHKRKGTASANSPISVSSAQDAVPSTSEENSPKPNRKKCDTALQFQAQEREVHQHRYDWTPCRQTCEPTSQKRWNSAYKSNRLFQFCS